jgi:hypothetical protein
MAHHAAIHAMSHLFGYLLKKKNADSEKKQNSESDSYCSCQRLCHFALAFLWKLTCFYMVVYCFVLKEQSIRSMSIGIFATALVVVKLLWVRIGRALAFFCICLSIVCRRCWIPLRRPTLFACTRIATVMLHSLGLFSIALVYYDIQQTAGALRVDTKNERFLTTMVIFFLPLFWGIPTVFFLFQYFSFCPKTQKTRLPGFSCSRSPDPLFCGLYYRRHNDCGSEGRYWMSCIFDEIFCQNTCCCCYLHLSDLDSKNLFYPKESLCWFEDPPASSTFFDALMISESENASLAPFLSHTSMFHSLSPAAASSMP